MVVSVAENISLAYPLQVVLTDQRLTLLRLKRLHNVRQQPFQLLRDETCIIYLLLTNTHIKVHELSQSDQKEKNVKFT